MSSSLTEKLIGYDTSTAEGIKQCAGFVKGWLDARNIDTRQIDCRGLPVTLAEVGPADAETTLLLHGHIDVVPGRPEQFEPRVDGDRLVGRGAYDMKGALAAMLLAVADLRDSEHRPRAARRRARRGVRGGGRARRRPARLRGLSRRLRDHRRADRHARRGGREGRGRDADPRRRARGARGHAVAGRERDPARNRRVPRDPIATVCVPELGALRPAVDQPRPDPRRRRAEQSARHLLHRRRRPLPARAGSAARSSTRSPASRPRRSSPPSRGRRRWSTPSRRSFGPCAPRRPHITTAR